MKMVTREQADKAMEPIWEIKKRIYEETKDMTSEERREYYRRHSDEFTQQRLQAKNEKCDLPFLRKKPASDSGE